ncbi:MAG: hypothetical protein M1823_000967 [Watsoniomyces obsoletus]|nr:MAG: hypothetical protein M1823_000967 [Watsoniomyces obsoletus]
MEGAQRATEAFQSQRALNWIFLVELVVCGILAIFFLFYFNRLFATLLSYAIRAYTWRKWRVYVDIQSLQISLLAGRVFFKGFRYHGENETILIHSGHVTFRYWLRRVRQTDQSRERKGERRSPSARNLSEKPRDDEKEKGSLEPSRELPCRLFLDVKGLEWFIYNRTAAYEAIISNISGRSKDGRGSEENGSAAPPGSGIGAQDAARARQRRPARPTQTDPRSESTPEEPSLSLGGEDGQRPVAPASGSENSDNSLLKLLPIQLHCTKGAVVIGNDSVRSILILKYENATGDIDASSCSPLDSYKQVFNLHFTNPVVLLKPNLAHKESPQASAVGERMSEAERNSVNTHGGRARQRQEKSPRYRRLFKTNLFRRRPQSKRGPSDLPYSHEQNTRPTERRSADKKWLGLSRYLEDDTPDEHDSWKSIEYGRVPTIVDSPSVNISYHWDVAGQVPPRRSSQGWLGPGEVDLNGDPAPEWGMTVSLRGGTINYGPWTDKHRLELQSVFFPRSFTDASPSQRLAPGQTRISTSFKVFIEIQDQIILRIPTREPSKDWKWSMQAGAYQNVRKGPKGSPKKKASKKKGDKSVNSIEVRPFGWLDAKVLSNSTISYKMDMVASENGYHNSLNLDLRGTELSSSVNHAPWWRSETVRISCDLSTPLKWNGLHTWAFQIVGHHPELFFLREHVFLFQDLTADWSADYVPNYYTFVPVRYLVDLQLFDFQLFLNLNDGNIINNPCDLDDNSFIVARGPRLDANLTIPLNRYRPESTEVPFRLQAKKAWIDLHTPPWKTQAAFLQSPQIGAIDDIVFAARYKYYAARAPTLNDSFLLEIEGTSPTVNLFGFMVRYFIKIRDNYFGDDIHFKTLEEHHALPSRQKPHPEGNQIPERPMSISNDLDVIVRISATDLRISLPSSMYSAQRSVQFDTPSLDLELRFTNYYMDLMVEFSPLTGFQRNDLAPKATPRLERDQSRVFIDGLEIHGHRLFGLPPTEPTYMCNWDFRVGSVSGECDAGLLQSLQSGLRNFGFSFSDDENALPATTLEIIRDVTFLRARIQSVHVWLHVEPTAVLLSTAQIKVDFNDWATESLSKRVEVLLPDLSVTLVDPYSGCRHAKKSGNLVRPQALFETTISVSVLTVDKSPSTVFGQQQRYIELHDSRTSRTPFLVRSSGGTLPSVHNPGQQVSPPSMPLPPLPFPMLASDVSSIETGWEGRNTGKTPKRVLSVHSSTSSRQTPRPSGGSSISSDSRPSAQAGRASRSMPADGIGPSAGIAPHTDSNPPPPNRSGIRTSNRISQPLIAGSAFLASPLSLDTVTIDRIFLQDLYQGTQRDPVRRESLVDPGTVLPSRLDESASHTAIFISLSAATTAYTSLKGITLLGQLVTRLESNNLGDLLDEMHAAVLSKVIEIGNLETTDSGTLSLQLNIPHLGLRLADDYDAVPRQRGETLGTEFDVRLSELRLRTRFAVKATENDYPIKEKELTTLHASLDSLDFAMYEICEGRTSRRSALRGSVGEALAWIHRTAEASVNIRLREIGAEVLSSQLELLVLFALHISAISQDLSETFSVLSQRKRDRLRTFVSFLISAGSAVPDPASLTRPSYVLRSAPDHLRLTDSWKILCRLRQILKNISPQTRIELESRVKSGAEGHPAQTPQSTIESLSEWRSWELANVKKSYIIQEVYGSLQGSTSKQQDGGLGKLAFRAGSVKLLVDPGSKQSGLEVDGLMFNIADSMNPPLGKATASSPTRTTTAELYTVQTAVTVNWKLCEVAEWALHYHRPRAQDYKEQDATQKRPDTPAASTGHVYQMVLVTEVLQVSVDSLNFTSISTCKDLHGSFATGKALETGSTSHISIQASAILSEILSGTSVLLSLALDHPVLCFLPEYENDPLRLAITSREVSLGTREEMPAITDTIDMVIAEEAAHILYLVKQSATPGANRPQTKSTKDNNSRFKMILSLDTYTLSLVLLPSLSYLMTGNWARISVLSHRGPQLVTNFDIAKQLHQILLHTTSEAQELAHIRTPPLNGRLVHLSGGAESDCQVHVLVDKVKVDAAMVTTLLATLSRPEIINMGKEIITSFQSINAQVDKVFVPHDGKRKKATEPSRVIFLDGSLAVAGLAIRANIPELGGDSDACSIELDLGCVQVKAGNKPQHREQGPIPLNFRVDLQRVLFEIVQSRDSLRHPGGSITLEAHMEKSSKADKQGELMGLYAALIKGLRVSIYPETASLLVRASSYLQTSVKDLELTKEARSLHRRRRSKRSPVRVAPQQDADLGQSVSSDILADIGSSIEVLDSRVTWHVSSLAHKPSLEPSEDLVLSLESAHLATKKDRSGRLKMDSLLLAMVPISDVSTGRSKNSALLPEIVLNVAYLSSDRGRRFIFQAAGRSLDLRLTSQFIIPARAIERSINRASTLFKTASVLKGTPQLPPEVPPEAPKGRARPLSIYVDVDFAGSVVHVQNIKKVKSGEAGASTAGAAKTTPEGPKAPFATEDGSTTVLRSPGVTLKVEYKDEGLQSRSLDGEVRVNSSNNVLYPTVVPLVMQMSSSIKQILAEPQSSSEKAEAETKQQKPRTDESILKGDPSDLLGRLRLNLGLRICKQDFSLSCEPVAELTAMTGFEDVYITVNTVRSVENGQFIAISAVLSDFRASIQHRYSRESTGSFELSSIVLSMMNSRYLNGVGGISAILRASPAKASINARQVQDFMLFRDIWVPTDIERSHAPKSPASPKETQAYLVQRYQQVAAAAAFPWNATVSIAELNVQLDLGRALGRSSLTVTDLWISSRKSSTWEQNLCLGLKEINIFGSGRLSGFVVMQGCKVRTSIHWPSREPGRYEVPLIQAAVGIDHLRFKTAFDFQVFLVADVGSFHFFMFNVRDTSNTKADRLVGTLEGDQVQVFCTATCAAQFAALYQAIVRLVQEKRASYQAARLGLDKSRVPPSSTKEATTDESPVESQPDTPDTSGLRTPLSLHTSVVVTLKGLSIGVFPSTLFDKQVFKMEMLDAQARFAVAVHSGTIHGELGLTLGQLRVAVSALRAVDFPSKTEDVVVREILQRATESRDGTILRVPKVVATMQTWQDLNSTQIDYIFRSAFEGKVDVGWNYSRIGFIRGLWSSHSRALAQRLGKSFASSSAVKLTGGRPPESTGEGVGGGGEESSTSQTTRSPEKITAVVNVPQSKYDYRPLEPPIIETPQLRDMGEATPPLEWIGLHRERLPHLTHQIVIVALLGIAKEVEDAYSKILGSS